MLLKPSPASTRKFTYDAKTRTFSAGVSDLGRAFRLGRVYDDSCDVGFTMVFSRTGKEIVFAVWDSRYDDDGDLLFVELRAVGENFKAVVFND